MGREQGRGAIAMVAQAVAGKHADPGPRVAHTGGPRPVTWGLWLAAAPYDSAVLLAGDIGNSTIKAACFRASDAPSSVRTATTHRAMTADELDLLLAGLLALDGITFAVLSGIAAVSVVPDLTDALEAVAQRRFHGRPLLLATSANLPLPIRVDHPHEVGADRLMDAYAAHRLYGGALVVADVGTAVTIDAVGSDGAFLGGAIAAGPALGLRALADHTAKLPHVPLAAPPRAIGRDTVTALQSGAVFGWRDLVAGLVERVRAELAEHEGVEPARIRTVMTGGFAAGPWARAIGVDIVDEHLTLKGLAHFAADVNGAPADVTGSPAQAAP